MGRPGGSDPGSRAGFTEGARGEAAALRPDLYDRLSEVTIRLPLLRERAEEIPRLAAHAARRHGRPQTHVSAEAVAALTRHAWPGNVDALEKAISRAVVFRDGERVRAPELVPDRRGLHLFPAGRLEPKRGPATARPARQGMGGRRAGVAKWHAATSSTWT